MNIAFDCYSEKLVKADRLDNLIKAQPFRFVCPICGQTVNPAAKDSTKQCTHFRHLHGNNDTECEKYLGTHGFNGLKNKIKALHKKNLDFYFSKPSKRLFIGLKFSQEEIEKYQNSNAELAISCSAKGQPFLIKKINKTNFAADSCEKFEIIRYSEQYSITINNEQLLLYSSVLSPSNPSFFKVSDASNNALSKFLKSDTIYTNTPYIILLSAGNKVEIELRKSDSVILLDRFDFKIDKYGERVFGVEVCFKEITNDINNLLSSWGKNIKKSEQLDFLWPPSFEIEDCFYSNSEQILLRSSFVIEENINTKIKAQNIERKKNNIYEISKYNEKKISYKNIDMFFKHVEYNTKCELLTPSESYKKSIIVPNNNTFYLFSNDGIEKLSVGQTVYLTPNSFICEYRKNYQINIIKYINEQPIHGKELLFDILSNYKIQIPYELNVLDNIPQYLKAYLDSCKNIGWINAVVAQYIEEGKF